MEGTSQGKRAHDSGDGSGVSKKKSKFNISAENFPSIVRAGSYVDKSLLIHKLFYHEGASDNPDEEELKILITSPRRFGKSVNLDMIKCFLEVRNEEIGKDMRVEEKKNYNLFKDLNIMRSEYTDFVQEHFGKYPVLKMNFLCKDVIIELGDIVDFCKCVVRNIYMEHDYLQESKVLSNFERDLCKMWCSMGYKSMKRKDVAEGLELLSRCIYKHFNNTRVFVLIDEYDSPIMKALFNAEMNSVQLSHIMEFYIGLLCSVLKGNSYVFGAVVTGISYIAGMGLSSQMGTLTSYQFLDQQHFDGFYGFTSDEVKELFRKFELTEEQLNIAKEIYNGYKIKSRAQVLYNPCSVVKYVASSDKVPRSYWVNTGSISGLKEGFKHSIYREDLNMLLDGRAINIDVKNRIEKDDIKRLAALPTEGPQIPTREVFFSFLLEQGYLSYAGDDQNDDTLNVPNEEVRKEIVTKLTDFYIEEYNINQKKVQDCSSAFRKLFSSVRKVDQEFKAALQVVQGRLKDLLSDEIMSNVGKPNHATLQQILFVPLFRTGFEYCSEVYSPFKSKADAFLFKNKLGIIIELKCAQQVDDSRNSALEGLQQIFDNKYYELLRKSEYFPKSAEEYILMGLSVCAETKSVSLCTLRWKEGDDELTKEDIDKAVLVK